LEKRIAGDGIERLEASVHEDREAAKFAGMKACFRFLVEARQRPGGHEDEEEKNDPFFAVHASLLEIEFSPLTPALSPAVCTAAFKGEGERTAQRSVPTRQLIFFMRASVSEKAGGGSGIV
jgi:hypothetical protein